MAQRELHDLYFREAKREGYLSRAAYKLIEIDDRKRMMRHGDCVLDLGCAPGSWLQVASARVARKGTVVGVDLSPVRHQFPNDNVRTLVGDLTQIDPARLTEAAGARPDEGPPFDVILSDLAPPTSGSRTIDHHGSIRLCEHVLGLCRSLLKPGGWLVMKVFEGEAYSGLLAEARHHFTKVKGMKPKASRSESVEMYVVGEGYCGPNARPATDPVAPAETEIKLPTRQPSEGWSARRPMTKAR